MPKKQSTTDLALVVLGIIAWIAAVVFGAVLDTIETEQAVPGNIHLTKVKVPNIAAAGAACGFAIAGGLCFVGAVLASRLPQKESASSETTDIPETKH